jgi:hypothetical protein
MCSKTWLAVAMLTPARVSTAYAAIALALLVHHRREILPTLTAPLRRRPVPADEQRDRVLV